MINEIMMSSSDPSSSSSSSSTTNTWNPYHHTAPTKTVSSSSLAGYSTSSSPLDNSNPTAAANISTSSTSESSDRASSKVNPSLIPTPDNSDIKSEERFFTSSSNQPVICGSGSSVNATSNSDGASSTASSDLSSLSASSSPPYRSPPQSSSSYLSASSSLYAAAAVAAHSNYGLYAAANHHHHPYVPQQQGYHTFPAFDFNNPYYTSPNLSNAIHEQFKLTPLIKSDFDYSNHRYQSNTNSKQELLEKSSSPEAVQLNETNNTTNSTTLSPPLSNHHHHHHHHQHNQYPTHPIAYYNNMSLSSPVAPTMSHPYHQYPPHHHQIMQHVAAAAAASSSTSSVSPPSTNSSIQSHRKSSEPNNVYSSTPSAYSGLTLPTNTNNANSSGSSSTSSSSSSSSSSSGKPIKVKLAELSLWRQFNQIGTEMIITKSGRRMFPPLKVNVSGLESSKKYHMVIDIIPADDNRYKYHNGEWQITGKAEMPFGERFYNHPDSPLTGSQWMKQIISFHKLKLTNYVYDKTNIVLNSMHRYLPRLTIHEVETNTIHMHVLTDCVFMAVTAYQNESITKLKIEHNPFAKGFRDGQSRKPKRNSDDENESLEERGSYSQLLNNVQQQQQEQPPNKMSRVQSSDGGPLCAKDMNKYHSLPSQSHLNMQLDQQQQQQQQQQHINYHQYQQHLEHLSQLQMNNHPYSKFNQVNSSSKLEQNLSAESILFGC